MYFCFTNILFGDESNKIWKEKVKSVVAPWEQADQRREVPEDHNQIVGSISATSLPLPSYQPPPSNPGDSMSKGETAAANLSIVATQTIISDNINGVGRVTYHVMSR